MSLLFVALIGCIPFAFHSLDKKAIRIAVVFRHLLTLVFALADLLWTPMANRERFLWERLGTAFPYLFRPPERRSHGYFEGNMQILYVRRAMQVTSLTTDCYTILTLSQMYLSWNSCNVKHSFALAGLFLLYQYRCHDTTVQPQIWLLINLHPTDIFTIRCLPTGVQTDPRRIFSLPLCNRWDFGENELTTS
jgi:hypothetical protein